MIYVIIHFQFINLVIIRDSAVKSGENRKLKPDFKGPCKVLDKNRYVVQDIPE